MTSSLTSAPPKSAAARACTKFKPGGHPQRGTWRSSKTRARAVLAGMRARSPSTGNTTGARVPRPTGQGHMAPGEWSAEAGPSGQAHARNVRAECAAPALTWQGPLHALPRGKALARARCPAPTRRGHVAANEWSAGGGFYRCLPPSLLRDTLSSKVCR